MNNTDLTLKEQAQAIRIRRYLTKALEETSTVVVCAYEDDWYTLLTYDRKDVMDSELSITTAKACESDYGPDLPTLRVEPRLLKMLRQFTGGHEVAIEDMLAILPSERYYFCSVALVDLENE